MPEILLPSSTSIISSSSLLLYNHPQLTRRKFLPLRRISGWQWLSRRISRQGLNATHALPNHTHSHHDHHTHNDCDCDCDYDNERMIPNPQRRKMLAFGANYDYEKERARRTERDLAESYAAYCRAFTSAGLHQQQQQQQHKRKTWMMDGLIDMDQTISSDFPDSNGMHTVQVHAENDEDEDEERVDEKRETSEPEPEPQPPPQILTPSLYAEMRRAACDKKRALRPRRLWSWSWSWFPHIRPRESH